MENKIISLKMFLPSFLVCILGFFKVFKISDVKVFAFKPVGPVLSVMEIVNDKIKCLIINIKKTG